MKRMYSMLKEPTVTNNKFFTILLLTFGVFLNHSNIIFGINASLADLVLPIIIIKILINKNYKIPLRPLLFFILLSIIVIFSAIFVNNQYLNSSLTLNHLVKEYLKLIILFLYFLLGYSLSKIDLIDNALRGFSKGAFALSIISLVYLVFPISYLGDVLFFGETRFRGFMNDPNYFATLQLSALMYFFTMNTYKLRTKIISLLLFILSISLSGSKGGFISLSIVLLYLFVNEIVLKRKNLKSVTLMMVSLTFFTIFLVKSSDSNYLSIFSQIAPSFERVSTIFLDFGESISVGGSGRESAIKEALHLINISPFFGIGIGTYSSLNYIISGSKTIAHNTYLQLAVEWGLIVTIIFFLIVIIALIVSYRKKEPIIKIVRNMMIPLFLGSLSISLNNARIFWILLGSLLFFVSKKEVIEE